MLNLLLENNWSSH